MPHTKGTSGVLGLSGAFAFLLVLLAAQCDAFDIVSPVAHAVGSVASYGINKLVIDPQREREVFKVWKELRELEKKEAEENGGGDVESILPGGAIKNKDKKRLSSGELQGREFSSFTREGYDELHGQMSHYSGYLQSVGGGPGEGPEPIIDPRLAIDSDQCNSTGLLTFIFDGFTPGNKIRLYRSMRPAFDEGDRIRLPYSQRHHCGGTQLELTSERLFMSTEANSRGTAVSDFSLRDLRACSAFAYQAVDENSCLTSNLVILSQKTPMVPVSSLLTMSSNPYTYAKELNLP